MYSLMFETLDEHSFESQGLSLSDAQEALNQCSSSKVGGFLKMLDKLLELNHVDLLILQAVLESSFGDDSLGVDSKTIGAKVHLSRYAALERAKKLAQKGLLVQESGSKPKSAAKPTYYFLPSPDLTPKAVETALEEAVKNLPLPSKLESSKEDMSETDDSVLLKLDVRSLEILKIVAESDSQAIKAKEIEERSGLSAQATNARLRELVQKSLLTRQEHQFSTFSKGFVYSLTPGLTLSRISLILRQKAESPLELALSSMNGTRANEALFNGSTKMASQQQDQPEISKEKLAGTASLDKKLHLIWEMLDRAFHEIANLKTEVNQMKQNYQSVESFDPDPEQLLKVLSKNDQDEN